MVIDSFLQSLLNIIQSHPVMVAIIVLVAVVGNLLALLIQRYLGGCLRATSSRHAANRERQARKGG